MVDELVFALPPLGEGMVLDLLSGCGTATLELAMKANKQLSQRDKR